MSNWVSRFLTLFLIVSLSACFQVNMEAPYGPDVKVLPKDVPVEVTRRYQKWYAIWGIFELGPTSNPADIIAREKLVEARVYTEDSVEDVISGIFYVLLFPIGILLPQTIVVEGNRLPRSVEWQTDKECYSLND
ncbi:MAG TPA: hypothetical protein VIF37_20960 [Methylobacter sp.]